MCVLKSVSLGEVVCVCVKECRTCVRGNVCVQYKVSLGASLWENWV